MNAPFPARAVILAAGFGSRLRPLTNNHPKCLTPLAGRPLLERQLAVLRAEGAEDIAIVAGHLAEMLRRPGIEHVLNPDYERTNMVHSLFCARHLLDGTRDLIMCYGDIAYEPRVLRALLAAPFEISVVVDRGWHKLWSLRMEDPLTDAESLTLRPDGRLKSLGGKARSIEEIEGQYIGLVKIRSGAQARLCALYDGLDEAGPYGGRDKANMFMTTLIQRLIETGFDVGPAFTENGWLEIDSIADLEAYEAAARAGTLGQVYDAG